MKYTDSHEWALWEGDEVTIGITEFAKKELKDLCHLEFPKVGARLKQGEEAVIAESTKAASDIYAPLGGEVSAVNERLKKDPSLLCTEKDVWLFRIKDASLDEYAALLSAEEYTQLTG
ncbi:MAG: glycine cleavage system protein GcvH [Chlamydiota bacterium]